MTEKQPVDLGDDRDVEIVIRPKTESRPRQRVTLLAGP
jgi:hypothetical protein